MWGLIDCQKLKLVHILLHAYQLSMPRARDGYELRRGSRLQQSSMKVAVACRLLA